MAAREAGGVVSRVEARRRELRSDGGCRFVDTTTFVELLVAPRALERANDPAARVRGLRDRTIGLRYLIEEEALLREEPAEREFAFISRQIRESR
jgi:hypothetical protein